MPWQVSWPMSPIAKNVTSAAQNATRSARENSSTSEIPPRQGILCVRIDPSQSRNSPKQLPNSRKTSENQWNVARSRDAVGAQADAEDGADGAQEHEAGDPEVDGVKYSQ